MRNIWKKLTASLLALVLTVQLLPVSALADEFEIDDERHDTFTYEQPNVSGEIPELRGEYEKHFSLSDGTYSAVVYPYAVHYDEDGTWQEIDNTLRAGTEQYTVPAEAGTEYAELMPVELGGELVSLADSEDDTAAEPAPAEDPTDAVEPSPTEEPTAEEPKPTEEPVDSGNDAEIIIIDDEESLDAIAPPAEEAPVTTDAPIEDVPPEITDTPESPLEPEEPDSSPEPAADLELEDKTDALTSDGMVELNEAVLRNTANNFGVFLPARFTGNNRVGVSYKGYSVFFRPDDAEYVDAMSVAQQALDEETATPAIGEAVYAGLYKGVDVRYSLVGQMLKEYYEFSALEYTPGEIGTTLNAPGLIPALYEDGTIELQNDAGEAIFVIPRPYMLDASGAAEFNVETSVRLLTNGEIRIVYTLDKEWLNAEERAWPVTLDPSIKILVTNKSVEDTTTYSGRPNATTAYWQNFMVAGWMYTYINCRSYVRINALPELKSTDVILDASLRIYVEGRAAGNLTIGAYAVTEDSSLAYDCINWANTPAASDKVLDYQNIYKYNGLHYWNITKAVRAWYDGSLVNNGIMLKSDVEDTGVQSYAMMYQVQYNAGYGPQLTVHYTNASGIEDYWDYSTQGMGRAGTAYVQNFSGNLVMQRTDMSYSGNRMPASAGFYYNLSDRSSDVGYGYGWRNAYTQTIGAVTVGGTNYYKWVDGDGTEKYFLSSNGVWEDEAGQGYTLTVSGSSYTIRDKGNNTLSFDSSGRLVSINDGKISANKVTISYVSSDASNLRIDTVTDGAGRKYSYSYSGGQLASVSYLGSGADALETVTYTYSDGNLTQVSFADGKTAEYSWSGHIMTAAKDIARSDGSRDTLTFSYIQNPAASTFPVRISSLAYTSCGTSISSLAFEYATNYTKVTDNTGRWMAYQFNNNGNTTSVYNNEGQALYGRYAKDESSSGRANQLVASSRLQITDAWDDAVSVTTSDGETLSLISHRNLVSNGDFSSGLSGWTGRNNGSGDGAVSVPGIVSSDNISALCINGNSMAAKSYVYGISHPGGQVGDVFTFGAWVKSVSAPVSNKPDPNANYIRDNCIALSFEKDGVWQFNKYIHANDNCEDWQFLSGSVTASKEYDTIYFHCMYGYNVNEAYYTGVQVFEEPFEAKYEYDSNGNVTKITDIDGRVTSYAYNSNNDVTSITMPGGGQYSYSYDSNRLLTETVSATGVHTSYGYDAYGNSTSATIGGDGNKVIRSDTTYTSDGNMTASVTAGDRNTVTYANDTDRSLVNSVTDANGVATGYSYDSMRRLLATACGDAAVTNGYTDDLLSTLTHTNTSGKTTTYSFVYGAADLQTAVNIGSRSLVSNAYNSGTWTLSSQTYGNGDYWKYFYDNMDTLTSRFTNCSDNEGIGFYYTYNGKGKLVRIEMKSVTIADGAVTGGTLLSSENYLYDGSDRLIRVVETDGNNVVKHDFSWTYDAKDNVTALTESIGGKSFSYTYAYDDDSRPTSFGYGDVTKQVTYDGHGRSSGTTVKNGSRTVLGTGYAYRDVDSTYTTTQVKSVTNSYGGKTANFNYTYDANGNILSVSGDQTAVYEYDDLGQLITETIGTGYDQVIIRYTYDNGGNLIKKVREYTTEAPEPEPTPEPEPEPTPVPEPEPEPDPTPTPTPTPTPEPTPKPSREPIPINPPVTPTPSIMSLGDSDTAVNSSDRVTVQEETLYTYGDAEWGDLLTAYNGEEITYDGIGNPLSYRGWTMSWQGGRQLASMTKGSDTLSFVYNESGLRTSKTVNGVSHSYVWQGSKLAADITDAYALYFHYDSSGEVIGFTRTANGTDTEYFYVKNLQGDILKVITATGTEAATYTYDAWGKLLTSTGDLADVNPLRYRGYFYDTETSLYYLKSRYYDPEVGRFITTDAFASTGQGIIGTNMFAYCGNDPINYFDSSGCIPQAVEDRFVHDKVLEYICSQDSTKSLRYTETCIYLNGIDWRGGWGFCDLYNSVTGEVWELKKDSSSWRCSTVFANLQLGKYVNGVLKHNPELDLCRPYTTIISDGEFPIPGVFYKYRVTYTNEGNGILKYRYTKTPTEELLAIKAAIGAAGAALESAAQAILGWRSKAKRGIYFPEPA